MREHVMDEVPQDDVAGMRSGLSISQAPHSLIERIEHQERRLDVCEFVTYCKALDVDPMEGINLIKEAQKIK